MSERSVSTNVPSVASSRNGGRVVNNSGSFAFIPDERRGWFRRAYNLVPGRRNQLIVEKVKNATTRRSGENTRPVRMNVSDLPKFVEKKQSELKQKVVKNAMAELEQNLKKIVSKHKQKYNKKVIDEIVSKSLYSIPKYKEAIKFIRHADRVTIQPNPVTL